MWPCVSCVLLGGRGYYNHLWMEDDGERHPHLESSQVMLQGLVGSGSVSPITSFSVR